MEKVFSPEQAAKLLQLSPVTVKKYLRTGVIKGVKMGTKWRIPESDLQAYVDGLKAKREAKDYVRDDGE